MSQGRQKNQDCQNEFRQTSNGQMFFSMLFRQRKLSTIIKLDYEIKSNSLQIHIHLNEKILKLIFFLFNLFIFSS